ncbi:MAG: hypothetical protein JO076_09215 [Verrucomicrobia bacterium]|nr:hypothetical protein [Verrucomicrobiota bacterium]
MLIRRLRQDAIGFVEIEPIEAELLRQVPAVCGATDEETVRKRLFSEPAEETESQFLKDWEEFVRPELRHIFFSARMLVEEDLKALQSRPGRHARLDLPLSHGEPWLNALNQARLILASQYGLTEKELSMQKIPKLFSRRDLVLLQTNFYAAIQERIIDILVGGEQEDERV